ncbi:hypothetical protein Dimus_034855 [Dionaea muscipula]
MHIVELGGGGESIYGSCEEDSGDVVDGMSVADWDAKRVLIGAGARVLFYPTLLYNVLRNKFQSEFRWWDRVDPFVLLGAVPFPSDVPRLKELGVCGVITLNEPYETLVPTSLYHAHSIDHLVIPTRDYLFAPSSSDICLAVDFIHKNACYGRTTYVHCKAGRGRSTTIVLCYLVQHKGMTPDVAYNYVRSIRPRVLLASSQWQAVLDYYYHHKVKICGLNPGKCLVLKSVGFAANAMGGGSILAFDDCSVVVVTKSDLHGYEYDPSHDVDVNMNMNMKMIAAGTQIWEDHLSVICRVRIAGQAAMAKLSCLWRLRCRAQEKVDDQNLCRKSGFAVETGPIRGLTVDISVY